MHKSLHMHILKDITVQNDGFEPGTAVSSAVLNILTPFVDFNAIEAVLS